MVQTLRKMNSREKENMPASPQSISSLPPDILTNILSRLEVTGLLTLRCVCKGWCKLIDSQTFITAHLKRSMVTPKFLAFDPSNSKYCLIAKDPQPHGKKIYIKNVPEGLAESSCNGLLCVRRIAFNTGTIAGAGAMCHVVNPATREVKALPPCPFFHNDLLKIACGRDSVYKVVHVYTHQSAAYCDVFTLGADQSWRSVDGAYGQTQTDSLRMIDCPSINGAIHWLSDTGSSGEGGYPEKFIVAFDVGDEKFSIMALPHCCRGYEHCVKDFVLHHTIKLVDIGGFLCLLHVDATANYLDIWMLKDYAKKRWVHEDRVGLEWVRRDFGPLGKIPPKGLPPSMGRMNPQVPHPRDQPLWRIEPFAVVDGEVLMYVSVQGHVSEHRGPAPAKVSYHTGLKRLQRFQPESQDFATYFPCGTYLESLVPCKSKA